MEYLVPARALVGFRTETRGTGLLHQVFEGYEPWFGPLRTRTTGSLLADRRGMTTAYSLFAIQERGELFVGPGVEVYEGMIIGENARPDDIDVNPTKANHRAATADEKLVLAPPRRLRSFRFFGTLVVRRRH